MPTTFESRTYALVSRIPEGRVTTYGEIARALDTSPRAVGNALNRNPHPKEEVPCHRVVRSNGEVGGYQERNTKKQALLEGEGIKIRRGKISNFSNSLFKL